MSTATNIHPKAAAATLAALLTPIVAKLLGVDEAAVLGLVTAAVTFGLAWLAPGVASDDGDDGDNAIDPIAAPVETTSPANAGTDEVDQAGPADSPIGTV